MQSINETLERTPGAQPPSRGSSKTASVVLSSVDKSEVAGMARLLGYTSLSAYIDDCVRDRFNQDVASMSRLMQQLGMPRVFGVPRELELRILQGGQHDCTGSSDQQPA